MYKLTDFYLDSKFLDVLTKKWDETHSNSDIFRYKINKLQERLVDGKYLLQLNPDRRAKRRAPDEMNQVYQPFDQHKFNFTKVSSKEVLFSIEGQDADIHTVLVNVSPISRYHSLLCPSVNKCLPQVVTSESLALAIEIMFLAQDRNLRILFNSLCGFASVNHLHYHLFIEVNDFYVETVKWEQIKGNIFRLGKSYPVPAFCFKVNRDKVSQTLEDIFKALDHFLKKSIAHNILISRRCLDIDEVNIIIWPRKSTKGAKIFTVINVAVLELSGWFPIYNVENFTTLTANDLENELLKWHLDDFDNLCEEIKSL